MSEFFVQLTGFVGVAFFILSYQIRSNRVLFLCQLMGCLIFCAQFILMGAYTGALSLTVSIARNALLLKADDWKWVRSKATLSAILALLLIITVSTWAGWISLLPFTAVGAASIGYWSDNARKIRLSQLLVGSPCTLVYDLMVGSWGGVTSEAITLVSILVSIYRFGWKKLGEGALAVHTSAKGK